MSNRIKKLSVVLACVGMALAFGLGSASAKPVEAETGPAPSSALSAVCESTVFASGLAKPGPMLFMGTDLYVATFRAGAAITVVKIANSGVSSVFATIDVSGQPWASYLSPTDIAVDEAGNLFVASGNRFPGAYWKVTPGGDVSSISSGTARGPSSIEFDGAGNFYATDAFADVIVKNGASFASASVDLGLENGLLWDSSTLYALQMGSIQRVGAAGAFSLVADLGTPNAWTFALQRGTGQFYFPNADDSPDLVATVRPSGSPANVCSLGFDGSLGSDFEFGPDGALYASNSRGDTIYKIVLATPTETVEGLVDQLNELSLPSGSQNSLSVKLDAALDALGAGSTGSAKGHLRAFVNEVQAKCCAPSPGKTITQDEADALIAAAAAVLATLP